ncbi:hypothetical protein VNO78_18564 [Psophocarpus tetragonolobus]|uniref:Uncharacterized protein n=1 Tax=Psophocarpus tetragonolobus TaxID=3891 RepID=A0AAN9XM58_PSOTE
MDTRILLIAFENTAALCFFSFLLFSVQALALIIITTIELQCYNIVQCTAVSIRFHRRFGLVHAEVESLKKK